eukprot:TRINITY_DN5902_c0_g1_i1.p1 TRINITY_DN5902_c0_g1~~TRINITY_DN5902_c0_g1_i1.p1  ORF type:complete len:450 (-),score=99.33 TRINITY_DN5902_c0_g1_i1:87-1436(-)
MMKRVNFLQISMMIALLAGLTASYIPVYVMLPLNAITNNNEVNNPSQLLQQLQQLKSGGVDGVMTDVWWGIVEQTSQEYNWTAYQDLTTIVAKAGLKLKVIMSFHQCGGNVGDTCDITLPSWVLSIGDQNPSIYYNDREGDWDAEYLSSGVDHVPIFPNNRTAVNIYTDYMQSFHDNFGAVLGNTIVEVQIGMGPAGELRYPSYPSNRWSFPGVGEFQCYDDYLLADLKEYANSQGHSDWGLSGPDNAGTYNNAPSQTGFFSQNGGDNFQSPYGQFFLGWYAQRLIQHGDDILSAAHSIFSGSNVALAGKVSGIHWLYKDPSHAAELTAGYKNDQLSGYSPITDMFAKYGAYIDFTCLEMKDSEQPTSCLCGPEELVGQTMNNAKSSGIGYEGENALARYDNDAYGEMEYEATRVVPIKGLDYLRLSSTLLSNDNWQLFTQFVSNLHNA